MTQTGPLQWRTGAGWLVLFGGGRWEENEIIHSQAISAISDESPIAFLPAANPDPTVGEAFLSFYADLGAPRHREPLHQQLRLRPVPVKQRTLLQHRRQLFPLRRAPARQRWQGTAHRGGAAVNGQR
jgi:hypothetical protein